MTGAGTLRTDKSSLAKFKRALGRKYDSEAGPKRKYSLEIYDTFDWRLFSAGRFAYRDGGSFTVGKSLSESAELVAETGKAVPRFWWEFEDDAARDFLQGITGIRAVLPMAAASVEEESCNVRNRDGKIVCRYSFLSCGLPDGSTSSYVLIRPLRGYTAERDRLISLALKSGMAEAQTSVIEDILMSSGKQPGAYSSRLELRLGKKMTISQVAVLINLRLLSTIRANVEGVIADYDTEFLHDLRVATRRTRSFLTQMKDALPAEASRYSSGFKDVAQRCNELRDLDVYLLGKQGYYEMLPEHLHSGLDQYFDYITRKRARRHKEFEVYLQTDAFQSLLDGWESFLKDKASLVNGTPAIEVSSAKIRDRFQRIVKKGRRIDDSSPSASLHDMRIECKKLRYLLEFFQSYYPQDRMSELITHLKGFQDNLGEFNDLSIQQDDLRAYLRSSRSKQDAQLRDAAIGGLLTVLNRKQSGVRKAFGKRFAEFDAAENHELYSELFGRGKP